MADQEFKMRRRDRSRIIEREHIHIDNGGYSFELVQNEHTAPFLDWGTSLEISEGFYGYANSMIAMHHIKPEDLEKIGHFFINAAKRLREIGTHRKGE